MERPSFSSHHQAEVNHKHISTENLDLIQIFSEGHHDAAGGVVFFSGEVRNHNQGKTVDYLEYEAHAVLASKVIAKILEDARNEFPLHYANCVHRTGRLHIGDSAVAVVTASSHRKEAYDANAYIIHRVKHEAPIWKKEVYSDGSHTWGKNCEC